MYHSPVLLDESIESLEINENFIQSLNSLPTVSIAGHHSALGHDNRSLPTSKNNLLKETQSKSFCINFVSSVLASSN